jgi:hypothetical protein
MQITSHGGTGGNRGSKLAVFNLEKQWSGNFAATGVTSIEVDLMNPTSLSLTIRLVLMKKPAYEIWTTSMAASVPPDGLWRRYTFSLAEADMFHVEGTAPYSSTFTTVARFMLRHDPLGGHDDPPNIAASLGIDNITALPEPTFAGFGVLASIALMLRRRRKP